MNLPEEIMQLMEEEGVIRIALAGGNRVGLSIAQETVLRMLTDSNAKRMIIALPTDARAHETFAEIKKITDSLQDFMPSMDFEEFNRNPSKLRKLAELHRKEKLDNK